MWRKTWLVAVIAIIACRTALVGQQPVRAPILRGAVRDSTTSLALPGVVVSVLDARGATLARTIADGNGRFAVTVGAGAAQLHLIRIGFQPRDVTLPAHLPPSLELGMVRLPALLSAVHISDQELCPGSAERGAAFQLWEEARAGLLATIVARESNPAQAQFITYNRHTGPDDDRVIAQTTQILSGRTTRPFVASAPASTFARTGYMVESDSGRIFDAPDADVLLDESFATTHCFRLQRPDGSHSGQVGLAFAPVSSRARDTLVDVAGVIWIDEDTPQLRSLEFVYTALEPAATQAKTGGEETFRTMANGIAFVERWKLRIPVLAIPDQEPVRHDRYTAEPVPPPRRRQERYDFRVTQIVEAGGIVLDARWPDGESWHESPTGVSGVVQAHHGNAGIPNALVLLQGTTDTTMSDSSGHFVLEPVIPGKYTIVATDTTLHDFAGDRMQGQDVTVTRGTVTSTRLELTSVARWCQWRVGRGSSQFAASGGPSRFGFSSCATTQSLPIPPSSFPLDLRCRCVGECRERVATSAPTDIFRRSRFRGRRSIWRRAGRR